MNHTRHLRILAQLVVAAVVVALAVAGDAPIDPPPYLGDDTGACCFQDGTCFTVRDVTCFGAQGHFAGFGTTCIGATDWCAVLTPRQCDCVEDIDRDGVVGFGDVVAILSAWGNCE